MGYLFKQTVLRISVKENNLKTKDLEQLPPPKRKKKTTKDSKLQSDQ